MELIDPTTTDPDRLGGLAVWLDRERPVVDPPGTPATVAGRPAVTGNNHGPYVTVDLADGRYLMVIAFGDIALSDADLIRIVEGITITPVAGAPA